MLFLSSSEHPVPTAWYKYDFKKLLWEVGVNIQGYLKIFGGYSQFNIQRTLWC